MTWFVRMNIIHSSHQWFQMVEDVKKTTRSEIPNLYIVSSSGRWSIRDWRLCWGVESMIPHTNALLYPLLKFFIWHISDVNKWRYSYKCEDLRLIMFTCHTIHSSYKVKKTFASIPKIIKKLHRYYFRWIWLTGVPRISRPQIILRFLFL